MAIVITIVLVICTLVWCYTRRQTNEAFSSMRSYNIQTACRIHKVFIPKNAGDIQPLYKLQVVNRLNGETKNVGSTEIKFKKQIGYKHHLHSYSEAISTCMKNRQFSGFVLITSNAAIFPEYQKNQRFPTVFFNAAHEDQYTVKIKHETYINHPTSLRQHVYKLYSLIDKCKETNFCRFPFLKTDEVSKLELAKIEETSQEEPLTVPFKSIHEAKRYCSAIRQNEETTTQLIGFTCLRDSSEVQSFYKYISGNAKDYDFKDKWTKNDDITENDIDTSLVFYSYSDEPCRETEIDDDQIVEVRDFTREWEYGENSKIYPLLSQQELNHRTCKDKHDRDCFLDEDDTKKVIQTLTEKYEGNATNLALGPDLIQDKDKYENDPYQIFKDLNNKLFVRQRDRCCENRIGHSDTIPADSSMSINNLVSTGCDVKGLKGDFFNDTCNTMCERIDTNTPIYRKDLNACVPKDKKCLPNTIVCNSDEFSEQFKSACQGSCSKDCGENQIDKDRGFKQLSHHPKSAGETETEGEQIDVIQNHKQNSLNMCQIRCDADPKCDLFTIDGCTPSSDDCWGTCTLKKRRSTSGGEIKLSNNRINPSMRVYAKSKPDMDDPHVSDFYKRHNYCRVDGGPYYKYVHGADYEPILTQKRADEDMNPPVAGTSELAGFRNYEPEPESTIDKWMVDEDGTYSTTDGSIIKLESYYPSLFMGISDKGETIHFRKDKNVTSSSDEVLRVYLLLQFNKNKKITYNIQKMIKNELSNSRNYNIRVERVPPDTLNRFKCTVDIYIQDNQDGSYEQSMLTKALDTIENLSGTHQYTIIDKSSPNYVSNLLKHNQMEVRCYDANWNVFDTFTISSQQIKAKRHMKNSVKLDVVFNKMKGLSGKGQTCEVKFNVNIDTYRFDPKQEAFQMIAAKHNIPFLKLMQMNNFKRTSPLKVPDTRTKVFVYLELKPFSNEFQFYNGRIFPLYLNNKYIQLKSGNYTLRLSSRQNEPVILLKHEGSNDKYEWFFTYNKSNLFHAHEMIGKMFLENIALCFRVQHMSAGQSIRITSMSTK